MVSGAVLVLSVCEQYLGGGAAESLQAALQPLHPAGQLAAFQAQQTAVQLDLLQEGFGGGVVVPPFVGKVLFGCVIDSRMDECHEFTDRLLHLRLPEGGITEAIPSR